MLRPIRRIIENSNANSHFERDAGLKVWILESLGKVKWEKKGDATGYHTNDLFMR